MNAKQNGVKSTIYESDIYANVTGKFDCIITNPPIRTGKETVMEFLIGAKDYLTEKRPSIMVGRVLQELNTQVLPNIYLLEVIMCSHSMIILTSHILQMVDIRIHLKMLRRRDLR